MNKVLPRFSVFCVAALFAVACGSGDDDDSGGSADANPCGNGRVDPGELCDDGNREDDDDCTNACVFPCGDGVVAPSEICDTAIAMGEAGACPMVSGDCDDGVVCTEDNVVGTDCQAACDNPIIEDFIDGDGCCPDVTDAVAFNDFDCASACGNGLVELGEHCDTAIAEGNPGACPTEASDCDDGIACTDDVFDLPADNMPGDGACRATCTYTEHTAVADGDGCCPAGADFTTDDDCVGDREAGTTTCGNGVRNAAAGELCDTGIEPGLPNACPTECVNEDACVHAMLLSAGTCQAICHEYDQAYPLNGDLCCPVFYGGNNRNDDDCTTSCGTPAEECTLGEDNCDLNCRIDRTAFRITTLTLADPHIWWDIGNGACADLTSIANNTVFPDAMKNDTNNDGFADLTIMLAMKPLNQVDAESTEMDLLFGDCAPGPDPADTVCVADPLTPRIALTSTNQATGVCLDVVPNTVTESYGTPPQAIDGPCFSTEEFNAPEFALGSLSVPLESARIAGVYDMDPATGVASGLLLGFVSEAAAEAALIPDSVTLIGGQPLSGVLAGGIVPGSCTVGATVETIGDDREVGPDGTTMGWWFYVNFTAAQVPFDDRPNASE